MLEEGTLIDAKYRIVRKIGEGGMGAVFEGEAVRIHRRVAIKVMLPGQDAEQLASRFKLEAQAAGRIGSNHIVEVLDLGALESGEQFMVMEFLEGESMRARLGRIGRLPPPELISIVLQLLDALHAAHAAHIIHRDLKPDNVFLVKQPGGDFVKLLDFGVSKFNAGNANMSLTRTGSVLGTPYYMSPEQASGKPVDHRADLYAVGVILYEGLSGSVPFTADSFNELLFKIVLEQPLSLQERIPGIDPGLYAIVEKSMARDPAERFQSAEEMRGALAAWVPAGLTTLAQSGISMPASSASKAPTPLPVRSNPNIRPNTLGSWAKSRAETGEEPARSVRWALVGVAATVGIAAAALFVFGGSSADSQSSANAGMPSSTDEASPPPRELTPTRVPTITPSEPLSAPEVLVPPPQPQKEEPEEARPTDRNPRSQAPVRTQRVSRPAAAPVSTPRRVADPSPPVVAAPPPAPVAPPPTPAPTPAPKDDAARTPSGRYIRSDL